jgi:hypothetical protein
MTDIEADVALIEAEAPANEQDEWFDTLIDILSLKETT